MIEVLKAFTGDPKVIGLAILVALDVVMGVFAAVKLRDFSFGRLADFLQDDVLGKLIPYYALWAAVYVGGDIILPIVDIGAIAAGAFAIVAASLVASLYTSLQDLGLMQGDG